MTISDPSQHDLFGKPSFHTLEVLRAPDGKPPIFVIACGQRKKRSSSQAKYLYTSPRFRMSVAIAENLGAKYFVVSALHGLVDPEMVLDPYDFGISELDEKSKLVWAGSVVADLDVAAQGRPIVIVADRDYAESISLQNSSRKKPLHLVTPLLNLEPENHEVWIEQALQMSFRLRDLKVLYEIIDRARGGEKIFNLGNLKDQALPERGVYIFLDPKEKNYDGSAPRIVRIGTHAVSMGSKATMRNRLRNHLGKADGLGNHRGSIFRLHVGSALLSASENKSKLESWGVGQNADAKTLAREANHERLVTEYLKSLEVFIIPVADDASKNSMRAQIETQLIALLTEGLNVIEQPSSEWLGLKSPLETIVKSGLWNLRDVGKSYSPDGVGAVKSINSIIEGNE